MSADVDRSRRLERLGVILILIAALWPRVRDLRAPFDREFEGYQAAFFAIGAVNYERLGVESAGGYPVINIELGPREDPLRGIWDRPERWFVYANHPPFVPLLAWSAIAAGAPREWSTSWKEARPPQGIEPWIRAPFLIASMLSLLALWWAVRQAAGARRALLALAIAASLPISIVYATLVNYENPALLCAIVAAGFFARWIRRDRPSDLLACSLAFAVGSCVTFAGLFFALPLALVAWARRGVRKAAAFCVAALVCGLAPLLAHGAWSQITQVRLGLDPLPLRVRARELWAPLLDGTHPLSEWAALQGERLVQWFSWPVLIAAALGLIASIVIAARARSTSTNSDRTLNMEFALLAGGALYLLAFYRHTLDPQFTFLILLAPGIAGLAALALDVAADRVNRPGRAQLPLVIVTAVLVVFGWISADRLRFDFRAREGETLGDRNLPPLPMPDVSGTEIASLVPAGGFAIHPACLGLNLAVSYYAWRSLWPANSPDDPTPKAVARHYGLGAAPHVLLLPKHPWPSIAGTIQEFERTMVGGAPPDRESAHWRAWDLH